MPVQRIVMPDGSTKAFPENTRPREIRAVMDEMRTRMREEGHPGGCIVTQFRGDDDYRSPDPSQSPDIQPSDEQRTLAIGRIDTLPRNTEGYE